MIFDKELDDRLIGSFSPEPDFPDGNVGYFGGICRASNGFNNSYYGYDSFSGSYHEEPRNLENLRIWLVRSEQGWYWLVGSSVRDGFGGMSLECVDSSCAFFKSSSEALKNYEETSMFSCELSVYATGGMFV